jgi:intein/homing endonuclease
MVELLRRAVGFIVDSAGVELERLVRCINGNGGRTSVDGIEESVLISRGNIRVSGDSGTNVAGVETARVGTSGGVRVRSLSINSLVGNDVLEGLVHETTVATLVAFGGRAIDEVLLRKADERLGGQEVSTLDGTSGGERPARSALTLVLNSSNGTLGSPVPLGRNIRVNLGLGERSYGLGNVHAASPAGELFSGLVSELVDGDSEAFGLGIVVVNEIKVGSENGETLVVFDKRSVFLVVLGLPLVEGKNVFALRESKSASKKCDEEQ